MAETFNTSSSINELRSRLAKEEEELREFKRSIMDKMLKGEIDQNDEEIKDRIFAQIRNRFNGILKIQKDITRLEQAQKTTGIVDMPDEER